MSKFQAPTFQWSFIHPRYLHTWLGVGLMFLISWLPYRLQRFLGFRIGRLMMKVLKKRSHIAERNLELCFPEMTAAQRQTMLVQNFEHSGLALFEIGMAWFWPEWRMRRHMSYEGMEHLEALEAQGKGALVIAVHSLNLELGARGFGLEAPGKGVYRPHKNPVYDWFQYRGRTRENGALDRLDVKGMIRDLKKGTRLWYAPDHDYGRHRYAWAPLFAVEKACTTTGTSLLVNASKCAVVPFTITRDSQGTGYTMTVEPPLEEFPYKDEQGAAVYINKAIEKSIMKAPEQYMWMHRRFKSRPEGEPSVYD